MKSKLHTALVVVLILAGAALPGAAVETGPSSFIEPAVSPVAGPPDAQAIARRYIQGPRGGCYYINSNGNKTYVDRSRCR